jgi:exonuclease VII small subunit
MTELDDLVAKLKLDISDYEKNAKKAEKATDSLEKETKDLEKTNKSAGDSFDKLMTAFTGLNQGIQLVQQAYQVLQKGYQAVITETVAYAEKVRSLSRTIGSSAEDASKLIQAADDVKVSYESLSTGMQIAIRNGLEPTIDGMGKLSDQYIAIQDPIGRAKFLLDNFGRSGADLAPLMELGADGIRELGDAAESTGLVLSQVDIDATRTYEKAVDEIGDTFEGLKVEVGLELIPFVSGELKAVSNLINAIKIYNDSLDRLRSSQKAGVISVTEFGVAVTELNKTFWSSYDIGDTNFLPAMEAQKTKIYELTQTQDELVMSIFNTTSSYEEFSAGMAAAGLDMGMITEEIYNQEVAAAKLPGALSAMDAALANNKKTQESTKTAVANLTTEYQTQAGVLRDDLAKAYGELADAEDTWRNGVGSSIKAGLDKAYEDNLITLDEYIARLEILDQYAGTQYAYEFKIEQNIPELVESLLTDPESFVTKAEAFEDYFMPLDNSIKDAKGRIAELEADLVALERNYNVKVMIYSNALGSVGVGADLAYEEYQGPGYASGGITHHLSPVTVGEFGPEPFIPAEDGRILSHADAMNAIGGGGDGDNSAMLSLILLELRDLPQGMKVAMQEAVALMGG